MIYSEVERKEIEHVYGVFKDYIHASKFLDFVWSEKLGYLLLHIDPTKNTIEEDQIITSADELCAELFNEVATDVFQEAKREHFYPDCQRNEIFRPVRCYVCCSYHCVPAYFPAVSFPV